MRHVWGHPIRLGLSARSYISPGRVVFLAASTVTLAGVAAQAQTVSPSQVTPSQLRPAPVSSASIALPAAPDLVAPPNAANLSLALGGVTVAGGFDELKGKTEAITDGLVGRKITVADIYSAASALEAAYAAAGYALVRVVVPPQKLDPHGTLKLIVVDGYVETVEVKGVPDRQRAVVAARMAPLIGRRHVKLTDIERRVLLASDVPGLTLRSTLTPGASLGAAKLVLEATDKLESGSVGVDNNLPRSLGRWEYNAALQLNSVFGQGEQIYFSATTGYDLGKLFNGVTPIQIFGGGFVLPLGVDGLTINPEYTNSQTRPSPFGGVPPTTGYFQRADLRASYPVIRTRNETLTLSSTLEWDQEYLVADGFAADLYRDEYFVGRLKADSLTSLSGGSSVQASGVLSQGLGGRTGSGSPVPLSQLGASPEFTKFNVNLHWAQPLPQAFNVAFLGAGQTSFGRPLMIAEQFSLDGPDAVSGFPTGTFIVDEGVYGRAELGRTFTAPINGSLLVVEPYVFGAAGAGIIDQPTAVQLGTINIGSAGIGARTTFNAKTVPVGADLALELARYVSDVPSEREGWRGNLSFAIRF